MSRLQTKRPDEELIEFYFSLKNWPEWPNPFYKENNIKFGRFLKPARNLLELFDGDIFRTQLFLIKVAEKANRECLEEWGLEFALDKFLELN